MENQTYEQEVDLKDLILAILRRWRSIIVVGILMAVVLGGYAAVSAAGQARKNLRMRWLSMRARRPAWRWR